MANSSPSIFVKVFILGGFKSHVLEVLIIRELPLRFLQVLNTKELSFRGSKTENHCPSIRNIGSWKFGWAKPRLFLKRDPSLTVFAQTDGRSTVNAGQRRHR